MWNLMSRSESIDSIMLQHMEWTEDCLSIEEQGHKGDQKGVRESIYAIAVSNPGTCRPSFSWPERTVTGKQQLFIGSYNKNRFGLTLHRVIAALDEEETCILGCNPDEIGTHSLRKGSSSYALGQVYGPTTVSVYLRVGQSLGKLKDRYIHFGERADQLCGRMTAGLPFNSERFALLPPHSPSPRVV
ncbi:hypothetical protein JG687_00013971 [Phytophthora cactorum]|uniref:Uncharacterized protein n=1 Tax=Phytophthora cactorum TaxID=29920 RepID=A0A8T1TY24_9STRA|nr:hypothetical protein JG687_00013971 [Phytophthora cactorum]